MNEIELSKKFGHVVRRLRLDAGLSQEAFADRCRLHRTYIGTIERGEKRVTIATAFKLAEALGVPLWQMFRSVEEADSN